jgi:hypothetical protein
MGRKEVKNQAQTILTMGLDQIAKVVPHLDEPLVRILLLGAKSPLVHYPTIIFCLATNLFKK